MLLRYSYSSLTHAQMYARLPRQMRRPCAIIGQWAAPPPKIAGLASCQNGLRMKNAHPLTEGETIVKIRIVAILGLGLALILSACGALGGTTTTGTNTDAGAAGNYLPNIAGYQVTQAENITSAITTAAGEGAAALDNAVIQQVVTRIDSFIQCYSDVGAVAANVYTKVDLGALLTGNVPAAGAVAVVNRDRVTENLIACALGTNQRSFSAQSAGVTLCSSSGEFSAAGNNFTYIYVSTDQAFCDAVVNHFSTIR